MATLLSTQPRSYGFWGRISQQGLQGGMKSLPRTEGNYWLLSSWPSPILQAEGEKIHNSKIRPHVSFSV
jgi:hypothetical protein